MVSAVVVSMTSLLCIVLHIADTVFVFECIFVESLIVKNIIAFLRIVVDYKHDRAKIRMSNRPTLRSQ